MMFLKRSTLAITLSLLVNSASANEVNPSHESDDSSVTPPIVQVIPSETLFLKGNPVILPFLEDDEGKRRTGLRLIPAGIYHTSDEQQRSVWTVQNSNEEAIPILLMNSETEWTVTYTIPANSSASFASPAITDSLEHHLYIPRPAKGDKPARHRQIDTQLASNEVFTLPVSQQDESEVYSKGLSAWRKKDVLFGGASCASCHSPDGFDLAYFNFDRDTILRRAAPHLPDVEDQEAIADLIEYLRDEYQITEPKDPMNFRPFQPGGEVIVGENRYERDLEFGRYFQQKGYRFATHPVLSKEEALLQKDEWMSMDVRQIPIGIELPRWSEDGFHGEQHKSINDWLPLVPRFPKENNEAHWFALQDAYLKSPTDENFLAYYDAINHEFFRANKRRSDFAFTDHPFEGNGKIVGLEKFRSVQIATHLFRQEHLEAGKSFVERPPVIFDRIVQMKGRHERQTMNNPMWEVGDYFRKHNGKKANIEMPDTPEGLLDTFLPLDQAANQARVSWLTLGWLFDPALQKTGRAGSKMTINGAYLQRTFSNKRLLGPINDESERIGFPIHSLYIFTHKVLGKNFAEYVVACEPVCETDEFTIVSANFLSNRQALKNLPKNQPELRQTYIDYTLNVIRMLSYLIEDKVDRGESVSNDVRTKLLQAKQFVNVLQNENSHYTHDIELLERVREKLL